MRNGLSFVVEKPMIPFGPQHPKHNQAKLIVKKNVGILSLLKNKQTE